MGRHSRDALNESRPKLIRPRDRFWMTKAVDPTQALPFGHQDPEAVIAYSYDDRSGTQKSRMILRLQVRLLGRL